MFLYCRLLAATTSTIIALLAPHFSVVHAAPKENPLNPRAIGPIQSTAIVNQNRTIVTGGTARWFLLDVPDPSLNGEKPWPIIFSFHGRGRTASQQRTLANFHKAGVNHIVVTPQGLLGSPRNSDPTHTPKSCWEGAPYSVPYRDDVGFVRDVLAALQREFWVDSNRVYAAGKSNGAGFTGLLGCRASDIFAAIAPVAGPFYNATDRSTPNPNCHPTRALSIIHFHGTSDDDVPYTGSLSWEGGRLPDVFVWATWWATSPATPNHCTTLSPLIQANMEVYSWTGCGPNHDKEVRHYKLINPGEHDWPSHFANIDNMDPDPDGPGPLTFLEAQVEATDLIVDFFKAHKLI